MTKTNNQHNANWVVGAVALLLVLLAGILAFYNYWRLHEASQVPAPQSAETADAADTTSGTDGMATGGMALHTPLPLSSSLDSTVVSTAQAPANPNTASPGIANQNTASSGVAQTVNLEPDVQKIEPSALAENSGLAIPLPLNQVPEPLFTGDIQAGQIVEALGAEGGGVFFCADASAHSVIMNEYQSGDRFTIIPASGEYEISPVENDGMLWYRLVAPDGLVGWMAAETFQVTEDEAPTPEPIPTVMPTPAG